jgi:hypothetical protein
MRLRSFDDARKEIARWSEPLVADRILMVYDQRLAGAEAASSQALAFQHRRMWRNLLEGQTARALEARRNLVRLAQKAHLGECDLEEIDRSILDELLGVILRRCQGSLMTARVQGMTLVMAASALGEIRKGA